MSVAAPQDFDEALDQLRARNVFGSDMSSAELKAISADFHQYNFASARTADAHYLQLLRDMLDKSMQADSTPGGAMDLSKFRALAKDYLRQTGYTAPEGEEDTVTDLSSDARLNLIYKTNQQVMAGYGNAIKANSVINIFPCAELYRAMFREKPRVWQVRWNAAGIESGDVAALKCLATHGRMVARRDSGIWQALGDGAGGFTDTLGNSWAPFAFNSGMRTRLIARPESIALGLIAGDTQVQPQKLSLVRSIADFATGGLASDIADAVNALVGKSEAGVAPADDNEAAP